MSEQPISLNIVAAAKATGIAKTTLQRMAKNGTAPAHRVGRRWVFPVAKLQAWINDAPTKFAEGK